MQNQSDLKSGAAAFLWYLLVPAYYMIWFIADRFGVFLRPAFLAIVMVVGLGIAVGAIGIQ
jgi:hypothetical protein